MQGDGHRAGRSGGGGRRLLGRRLRLQRLGQPRAACSSASSRSPSAAASATQRVIDRLRTQARATSRACACSCSRRRTCASAGGRATRNTSSRCGAPTSTSCSNGCRKVLDRVKQIAGVVDVTTDREQGGLQANVTIDRTAAARARRAHPGHRQRAQQRLLAAADLDHLQRSATSTASSSRSIRSYPARSERPVAASTSPGSGGSAGAALGRRACRARHRAAGGQPPGPVSRR